MDSVTGDDARKDVVEDLVAVCKLDQEEGLDKLLRQPALVIHFPHSLNYDAVVGGGLGFDTSDEDPAVLRVKADGFLVNILSTCGVITESVGRIKT